MIPDFRVEPCGRGWYWIVSDALKSQSSPRPNKRYAEQRLNEIVKQWKDKENEDKNGAIKFK